jgi:hypothetical protein
MEMRVRKNEEMQVNEICGKGMHPFEQHQQQNSERLDVFFGPQKDWMP